MGSHALGNERERGSFKDIFIWNSILYPHKCLAADVRTHASGNAREREFINKGTRYATFAKTQKTC